MKRTALRLICRGWRFRSRHRVLAGLLVTCVALLAGSREVQAAIIAGPGSFGTAGGNDTTWGIQFTALHNSTLTGFDFNQHPSTGLNPFTGTVSVIDVTTSNVVFSTTYGPNTTTVIAYSELNVGLHTGDIYQLVATSNIVANANNEVFEYGILNSPPFSFPVSDADIAVTRGVFNNNPGFQTANAWGAFTRLATISVPEPTSLVSFVLVAGVLAGHIGWRRRKQAALA